MNCRWVRWHAFGINYLVGEGGFADEGAESILESMGACGRRDVFGVQFSLVVEWGGVLGFKRVLVVGWTSAA